MNNLVNQLGIVFSFINEQIEKLIVVPKIIDIHYKIHVHDDTQRTIKTYTFNTMNEAMELVNATNLMYNREKKVFLEYVKGEENSMIELNIRSANVYEKRPTVYRS